MQQRHWGDHLLPRQSVSADITAGATSALISIPMFLAYGLILYGPLGPGMAISGMMAVMVGASVSALLASCLPGTPILAMGITSSSSLVLGTMFANMVANGDRPDFASAIAITIAASLGCALVQGLVYFAGAAKLAQLTPYPVISGLVNATAVLIMRSQIRDATGTSEFLPAAMFVAAVTIAVNLKPPVSWRFLPAPLLALVAGTATHFAIIAATGGVGPWHPGPQLAELPSLVEHVPDLVLGYDAMLHASMPWRTIVTVSLILALLSVLETITTSSAMDDRGIKVAPDADLRAVVLSNIAAAFAGSPPGAASLNSSSAIVRLGGQTRLAPAVRGGVVLVAGLFLGHLMAFIPRAALAGIVIVAGYRLLDLQPWHLLVRALKMRNRHTGDIVGSAAVSARVVAPARVFGLSAAVGAGAVASLVVFAAAMARGTVRRVHSGGAGLSRVRRGADATQALLDAGNSVSVIELTGALFFGNVVQVEKALRAAFAGGAQRAILDVSRIDRADLSGIRRLVSITNAHRADGRVVVLAPLRPGLAIADYLTVAALMPAETSASMPEALADAEAAVLARHRVRTDISLSPEQALAALGVPLPLIAGILAHAEMVDVACGTVLARAGEPAEAMFIICAGDIEVRLPSPAAPLLLARLATGAMVGEMAVIRGGKRAADILAATDCTLINISADSYRALKANHPDAAIALAEAIIGNVALNLRLANAAILALEH
jgi:SulP family sulfate permease